MAACVSVLNLKGGVGKTTIAAHVMRVLYHRHALKTLLVDLDPQFNLSQCLLTRKDYDHAIANGKSVFFSMEPVATSSLFDVSTTQKPPPDPMSICSGLRRYADDSVFLHPIPGDYRLIKYSLVSDTAKLASAKQRFLHFINLAKKQYDLVVIDCNPSSSFITMCALHACEHIIVPVRPDRYSILGLELVDKLLEEIPTINPRPDRKSTRLNSSHSQQSRMPSSA